VQICDNNKSDIQQVVVTISMPQSNKHQLL